MYILELIIQYNFLQTKLKISSEYKKISSGITIFPWKFSGEDIFWPNPSVRKHFSGGKFLPLKIVSDGKNVHLKIVLEFPVSSWKFYKYFRFLAEIIVSPAQNSKQFFFLAKYTTPVLPEFHLDGKISNTVSFVKKKKKTFKIFQHFQNLRKVEFDLK